MAIARGLSAPGRAPDSSPGDDPVGGVGARVGSAPLPADISSSALSPAADGRVGVRT